MLCCYLYHSLDLQLYLHHRVYLHRHLRLHPYHYRCLYLYLLCVRCFHVCLHRHLHHYVCRFFIYTFIFILILVFKSIFICILTKIKLNIRSSSSHVFGRYHAPQESIAHIKHRTHITRGLVWLGLLVFSCCVYMGPHTLNPQGRIC